MAVATVPIPKYLEQGSRGPLVCALLTILVIWAKLTGHTIPEGFRPDTELGPLGMKLIASYQAYLRHHISVGGGCGPEMRSSLLLEYGVNLQSVAEWIGGETIFVQVDGSEIAWSPELKVAA